MTQLALILLQLPSRQLTCASTEEKKMTTEMALYIILQQLIRAKLFWWLLNLSFKIRRPLYSCFSDTMTSLFGYLFTPLCISSFFSPFFVSSGIWAPLWSFWSFLVNILFLAATSSESVAQLRNWQVIIHGSPYDECVKQSHVRGGDFEKGQSAS